MKKEDLRHIYKCKRNDIDIFDLSKKISTNLFNLDFFLTKEVYHIFISIQNKKEIITDNIISILKKNKKKILVPRVNLDKHILENIILENETIFEISKYGIKEPANGEIIDDKTIDIVIIPLLIFDKRGYRVGYGKGFYDKFLYNCKEDVIKIGLSFFEAEEFIYDTNQYDIKLNYCVTPNNIYKF